MSNTEQKICDYCLQPLDNGRHHVRGACLETEEDVGVGWKDEWDWEDDLFDALFDASWRHCPLCGLEMTRNESLETEQHQKVYACKCGHKVNRQAAGSLHCIYQKKCCGKEYVQDTDGDLCWLEGKCTCKKDERLD